MSWCFPASKAACAVSGSQAGCGASFLGDLNLDDLGGLNLDESFFCQYQAVGTQRRSSLALAPQDSVLKRGRSSHHSSRGHSEKLQRMGTERGSVQVAMS